MKKRIFISVFVLVTFFLNLDVFSQSIVLPIDSLQAKEISKTVFSNDSTQFKQLKNTNRTINGKPINFPKRPLRDDEVIIAPKKIEIEK